MNKNEVFPLSSIQLAYFMGRNEKFELGGISTHAYYEMKTVLEPNSLEDALNQVIKQQPALRTVITKDGGQVVFEEVEWYKIEIADLREMDEDGRNRIIEANRKAMSHYVFAVGKWPMFEFKMFHLTQNEYLMTFGIDLMITDGSSIAIMLNEMMKCCVTGQKPDSLQGNFRDYILLQQENKTSKKYIKDKEYWEKNVDIIPPAPLVTNKEGRNLSKVTFKRKSLVLKKIQWDIIKEKCRQNNCSVTAALATIYAKVLDYYSGQEAMSINFTISDRRKLKYDAERLMGDFTTTMPLIVNQKMLNDSDFWKQVKNVKTSMLNVYKHISFDGIELAHLYGKRNGMKNAAVFPVVFTSLLLNREIFNRLEEYFTITYGLSQTPQVYLDCQVMEICGSLNISWDYVSEMFDETRINQMFRIFNNMITGLCDSDSIDQMLSLSDTEHQIYEKYNMTERKWKKYTLNELLEPSFREYKNNIAVQDKDKKITYHELEILTGEVALRLREGGVKAGDYVGILASRCVETVVNILAVIRCGAAYIPINPEHPQDRTDYILKHSGCKRLLRATDISELKLKQCRSLNMEIPVTGDSNAYVIYTSGSTGEPKGVVITHDAVCNTILDINERFKITDTDRVIGISSFCFDLSVYDIFGTLCSGATLILIPDVKDISYIAEVMNREKITVWNTVPAIMDVFIRERNRMEESQLQYWKSDNKNVIVEDTGNLRVVMLSGDWINIDLPDKIRRMYYNTQVYSLGGATEASIWSIYYPIGEISREWVSIPYGYPLMNQKFYVLDSKLRECPVGVIGELYIGGRGLAKEYQNDTEKTQISFFEHERYGRIYKTGDYGVMHPDGYIDFKGRRDSQVKISGHRIELEEIEKALTDYMGVDSIVVIPQKVNDQMILCAFYTGEKVILGNELKNYAAKKLPDYMIPTKYIWLSSIPLTANGKINKKELKLPDEITDNMIVEPQNKTEAEVADIWKQVLRIPKISVFDDYFDLGGDSLQLLIIISELEIKFGIKLAYSDLLYNTTIKKTAYLIENLLTDRNRKRVTVNIINGDKNIKFFMFPDIMGVGYIQKDMISVCGNYGAKLYDLEYNYCSKDLIDQYVEDIALSSRQESIILGGYSLGGNLAFEVAKKLEKLNVRVSKLILIDSYYVNENFQWDNEEEINDYINFMVKLYSDEDNQEQIKKRVKKVFDLFTGLVTNGSVEADILYIKSESDEEFTRNMRKNNYQWRGCTSGNFLLKQGCGKHVDMMNNKNAIANGGILKEYLIGESCS